MLKAAIAVMFTLLAMPAAAQQGKAGIQWVRISSGSFMMGADDLTDTKPPHQVTVQAFQMAKTLVTNKQYKACVAAGACTPATDYGEKFSGDDHPVVGVDWNQAHAFSSWAGGRLPSEAEWEYAARSAGKDWKYPWGDAEATCDKAVINVGGYGCGRNATWPVCSTPAGNTKQGLCDMAGDVWEWVRDWYHDSYKGAPADGSAWEAPAGSGRVYRGGSWGDEAVSARSTVRFGYNPDYRGFGMGFRPARSDTK